MRCDDLYSGGEAIPARQCFQGLLELLFFIQCQKVCYVNAERFPNHIVSGGKHLHFRSVLALILITAAKFKKGIFCSKHLSIGLVPASTVDVLLYKRLFLGQKK